MARAAHGTGLRDVYKRLARGIAWTSQPVEAIPLASALAAVIVIAALATGWLRHPIETRQQELPAARAK